MVAADIFIILDNVQYQRRGWIHRNEFTKISSETDWLTLPILKSSQTDTKIRDVTFRKSASMQELSSPFNISTKLAEISNIWPTFFNLGGYLLDYLESTIIATNSYLGLNVNVIRASSIDSDSDLKGEQRIINLCQLVGATTYTNASGGKTLYTEANFAKAGIKLNFLPDYKGSYLNSMERILSEKIAFLKSEIYSNL